MKKTLATLGGAALIILIAILALRNPLVDNKSPENELADYWQNQLITLGIADIGQPIEGFDDQLLIMAFPGLLPMDFDSVAAREGHYEFTASESIFVRGQQMPISSAERMITDAGFATLLANVSERLNIDPQTEADIDALIDKLNTAERITTKIDQGISALGVKVTPLAIIEDSRCPIDAQCIQAGTVRVRAQLQSGLGAADQIFKLNQAITTEAEIVTLIQVTPQPASTVTITPGEYEFVFQIQYRPEAI